MSEGRPFGRPLFYVPAAKGGNRKRVARDSSLAA